jgi:hypothetical protein
MNHPKIIAGRHGLPPTSNIPWSADGERELRRQLLFYFVGAWACALGSATLFFIRDWLAGMVCGVCCGIAAFAVSDLRRMLYAMLLNKPRTTEGLTQWVEHAKPQHTVDPEAFQFVCGCGRLVDMYLAPYFKDSARYSVICECGRGHFMLAEKVHSPKLVKK